MGKYLYLLVFVVSHDVAPLNVDKSMVIQFRHNGKSQSMHQFKCGHVQIDYVSKYKYLGLWFHEHIDYKFGVQ